MARTNPNDRERYIAALGAEQRARFQRAGLEWGKLICEVEVARKLDDTQYLEKHEWARGRCRGSIFVDHIDNNNSNNDPRNHQALCRGHNTRKNPPPKPTINKFVAGKGLEQSPKYTHTKESELEGSIEWKLRRKRLMPAQMRKNIESESKCMRAMVRLVEKYGAYPRKKLVDAGAFKGKCSQQAASNYLSKHTSELGPLDEKKHPKTEEMWVMKKGYTWPIEEIPE